MDRISVRNRVLVSALVALATLVPATRALAAGGQYQQVATLTNAAGSLDDAEGDAVAISADGSTLAVAVPGAITNTGAVYVYTRGPNGWANQTDPTALLPNDLSGGFATSVAVSQDGSVVVVGAPDSAGGSGGTSKVYVFVRPTSGWPAGSADYANAGMSYPGGSDFGEGVAIAPDGNYVAVGAPGYHATSSIQGAVLVYSRSGSVLSSPAGSAPLTGALGDELGRSVAMPSDTLIYAGAPDAGTAVGAVYGFSSETSENVGYGPWDQVSQTKMTATGSSQLGESVAAEGGIVAGGGPGEPLSQPNGSAYIFEPTFGCRSFAVSGCFSADTFTVPAAELTAPTGTGSLGDSIAVGADGTAVLVGDPSKYGAGRAFLFLQPAGGWENTSTAAATLIPADTVAADDFAAGVSISADGSTLAAGGPNENADFGGESDIWTSDTGSSISCQPATVDIDAQTTCTATVTDLGIGLLSPTGVVAFASSSPGGLVGASSCTLAAAGVGVSSCEVTLTATSVGLGTDPVSASYGGDDEHAGSAAQAFTIHQLAPTITVLSCHPAPAVLGEPTICTATVSDEQPAGGTPTGTIALSGAGAGAFSSILCALAGSGTSASCQVGYTPSAVGATGPALSATYSGDKVHDSSHGSDQLTVAAATTGSAPGTPSAQLIGGRIRLRLSCPRTERFCRITATLTTVSGTLSAGTIRVPGGRSRELTLVLRAAGLRRLSVGSHRVRVSLVSRYPSGRRVRKRLVGKCVIAAGPKLVRFTLVR